MLYGLNACLIFVVVKIKDIKIFPKYLDLPFSRLYLRHKRNKNAYPLKKYLYQPGKISLTSQPFLLDHFFYFNDLRDF
jgi:hypothetical protein